MTENYAKGDILEMIADIDSMKNSNNDRVQEIYQEVLFFFSIHAKLFYKTYNLFH